MRSTQVVQLFHHHPSGRVLTFSFSKFIFFYLRLNWSLSLTTAFCETKCSLSKLNIKAESIIQKAFRKKELDMHVIIEVQQKNFPSQSMRWQIQKGTYRLKLQRTWSLFELIISQIFANKIFPTKRLCWWNESCGFYVNIMGAIKQIQWSALIRISSSMSRCFTSLNYLGIIWENSQANWRLCLYLSCNPPSEGESFHPFGIVTNYTGRLMFLQK